jgi:hypothetical protein
VACSSSGDSGNSRIVRLLSGRAVRQQGKGGNGAAVAQGVRCSKNLRGFLTSKVVNVRKERRWLQGKAHASQRLHVSVHDVKM